MTPRTEPSASVALPAGIRACLFDLDGVLTPTATVHAAAWKEVLDEYLRGRAARLGERFLPFDRDRDYLEHVDGKRREDGARVFLASRGIVLPEGGPGDPVDAETVHGLAHRKNERVLELLREHPPDAYPGSVLLVRAVRAAGLRTAVVSASANCAEVLDATGIAALFDVRVDAVVAARRRLAGKPAPDTYLEAARLLDVGPPQAAVFEDSLAGVAAGRAGGFGLVVGVDRVGRETALREHGAGMVVSDLGELLRRADGGQRPRR